MSRSSLEDLWQKEWGEKMPSGRLPIGQSKIEPFYPIRFFKVAFDEGKPIAYRGYGDKGGYNLIGMAYTKPEYYRQGIYNRLQPTLSGKVIVGLSQRNPDFSKSDWESYWEGKGFTINPSDSDLDNIFGKDRDKSITDPFMKYYGNSDRTSWAVRGDGISKWQEVLKKKNKKWRKGS